MISKTIETEVLVCGGGCAGLAAALAAARNGAKTLLVERAGFAGGIITTVGLPYFDGLIDKATGRFVVKGIALEMLVALGAVRPGGDSIADCRPDLISKHWMTVRIPNVEEVKLLADDLLRERRLSVLYHSMACAAEVREGRVSGVLVANKDGLVRVEAGVVVDCTGDADVASWAGCPVMKREAAPLMPMTMHFRIGNVSPRREAAAEAKRALIAAHERGDLPAFYGPGLMYAFAPDEVYVHATRVPGDATDAADFSRAEMQGRRDAMTIFREWKARVAGFEDSYFIGSGPYLGVRDTRRIVGREVLTVDHLKESIRSEEAVATGCWFLDVHPPETTLDAPFTGSGFQPAPYDVAFGTLVPRGVANLLVAGRCHSATQEAAASSRVTATAMALGEAAGCAAALAARSESDVATLSGVAVREALAERGGGPFTDA